MSINAWFQWHARSAAPPALARTSAAGAPIVANAKYVTCDGNGTWCYQHGGESNGKTFTNSRLACQALNGDLVWWWVLVLWPASQHCLSASQVLHCFSCWPT